MAARDEGGTGLGAARVLDGDEVQGVLSGAFYQAPPTGEMKADSEKRRHFPVEDDGGPVSSKKPTQQLGPRVNSSPSSSTFTSTWLIGRPSVCCFLSSGESTRFHVPTSTSVEP